jgi:hypothetical protein
MFKVAIGTGLTDEAVENNAARLAGLTTWKK